jgi:hypothetical protein
MSLTTGAQMALFLGGTVPTPAPRAFVQAIEEVEVIQGGTPTGRDAFRITLGVGRGGLAAIEYDLLGSGLLDPMNRLAAVVVVGGMPSGLVDGVILDHQFAPSNRPGASRLVVTGEDITVMMDLKEQNQGFPNQPDGIIALRVLGQYARYGLVPAPTPTKDMDTILTRLTTQTETDFAFLTRLATRNGYVFYAEPTPIPAVSKATWGPEARIGVPQSALTMNFPVGSTALQMRFHLDALAPIDVSLPESAAPVAVGAITGALPGLGIPLSTSPLDAVRSRMARDVAKLSTTRSQARLAAAKASSPDALVAEGELDVTRYGKLLQARGLVGVRGVGPAHDGLYYVRQVVHKLKPRVGQYRQSFTLVREGRGTTTPVVRP